MDAVQTITVILATIGAVLGLINTIDLLSKKHLRLRVIPAHAFGVGSLKHLGDMIAIEITNFSEFPVTVCQVGFRMKSTKDSIVIINPIVSDGKPFPRKLEKRESVSVYIQKSDIDPESFCRVTRAYAKTACGVTKEGTSPALKQIIAECKSKHH